MDAQDQEHKWYDSKILQIEPAFSTAECLPGIFRGTAHDKLRVHFLGWSAKFEMWFSRASTSIQPLFTKRRNWRNFCLNDKVEMRLGVGADGRWFAGSVVAVDWVRAQVVVHRVDGFLYVLDDAFQVNEFC